MASTIKKFIQGPESPFDPPSLLYQLVFYPFKTFIRYLYYLLLFLRGPALYPPPLSSRIRLVCISDTHNQKSTSIPDGDVLVHAGDLTNQGTVSEIQEQINWLSSLPHPHKIAIAGNHDSFFDPRSRHKEDRGHSIKWGTVYYLQHSSITLKFPAQLNRQLTFYGAPQIPQCGGADFAFQYQRSEDAWSGTISRETDVLITHSPPKHHLDLPAALGCEYLLKEIWKIRPKVHVFGHVHAGYGQKSVFWDNGQQAFERLCARENPGYLIGLVSISLWIDVARVLWYGVQGIIWSRIWGGQGDGGIMVNASLTYNNTGKLGNLPHILDI